MSTIGSISALSSAETIDPKALQASLSASKASKSQKIDAAGTQFEAIFVRQFLGDALKPMVKGTMDEGGEANDTYRYFVTDQLAQNLAKQGVFGIGKQVAAQVKAKELHKVDASLAAKTGLGTNTALDTSKSVVQGLAADNFKQVANKK